MPHPGMEPMVLLGGREVRPSPRTARRRTTTAVYASLKADGKPLKDHGRFFCVRSSWVIVPEEHPSFIEIWGIFTLVTLITTAVIEPFTLAVGIVYPRFNTLLSFFLDLVFTADTVLQFFLAYPYSTHTSHKSLWERRPAKIASRYCAWPFSYGGAGGWFWVDLLSVLPGWLHLCGTRGTQSEKLTMLRLLRLGRLHKIDQFSVLMQNGHELYGIPLATVEVAKFAIITTLTCHWLACIWMVMDGRVTSGIISYSTEEESWLSALIKEKHQNPCDAEGGFLSDYSQEFCYYVIGLYWAITTLTTVGYGDITPQNSAEYVVCLVSMLLVASVWAWIVGCVVNLLAAIESANREHKEHTDHLLRLVARRNVPRQLKFKLLRCLRNSREHTDQLAEGAFLELRMTPGLLRELSWLRLDCTSFRNSVFWMDTLEEDCFLDIVRAMVPMFFGPREAISMWERMISIRRGRVVVRCIFMGRGSVLGHTDILFEGQHTLSPSTPVSLSFVDVLCLHRESLKHICREYPAADRRIRRAQCRTAVWHAFVAEAGKRRQKFRREMMTLSASHLMITEDSPTNFSAGASRFAGEPRDTSRDASLQRNASEVSKTHTMTLRPHASMGFGPSAQKGPSSADMMRIETKLDNVLSRLDDQHAMIAAQGEQLKSLIAPGGGVQRGSRRSFMASAALPQNAGFFSSS